MSPFETEWLADLSGRWIDRAHSRRPQNRMVIDAEQWIKQGKNTIKRARLSCRSFTANAVRFQLHALASNFANFMRTLALPEAVKQWSLNGLGNW